MLIIDLDNAGRELAVTRASASGVAPAPAQRVPHARLGRFGGAWVVSNFGRLQDGASLNGRPLRGSARLQDRDTLEFCGVAVMFTTRGEGPNPGPGKDAYDAAPPAVSAAEQRVLEALARPWIAGGGLAGPATNAEVAAELVLSVHTVKSHMRKLFGKFELGEIARSRKRMALVEAAFRTGLIGASG
jgi:DNA-binding CsgD family transcriptional regulator